MISYVGNGWNIQIELEAVVLTISVIAALGYLFKLIRSS